MKGIYYYRHPVQVYPVLQLKTFALPVEVVEDLGSRYRIKYLTPHEDGSPAGSLHKVLKRKVVVNPPWACPDNNIRLPYKD